MRAAGTRRCRNRIIGTIIVALLVSVIDIEAVADVEGEAFDGLQTGQTGTTRRDRTLVLAELLP